MTQLKFYADGLTYSKEHDQDRLKSQLSRVRRLMRDGEWRTLTDIQQAVGGSEAGISARLRDLRKTRHGSHAVEKKRVGDSRSGLHAYRLIVNPFAL